jgi:uncharacterized membrane protein YbhN (UPF0104 family)
MLLLALFIIGCRVLQVVRWILGIALLLALIVVVDRVLGWQSIIGDWQAVSAQALTAALALFLTSHLLRAFRIYHYSARALGLGYGDTVKISAVHQAFNNVLPMRLGEGAYPLLMRRYGGQAIGSALADLIWLRVLDLMIMGSLVVALIVGSVTGAMIMVMSAIATVALASFILASAIAAGRRGSGDANKSRLASVVTTLVDRAPATWGQQAVLLILTVAAWAAKLLGLLVLLDAMTALPMATILSSLVGGELSGILPVHGLAGAGTYEAAFVGAGTLGGEPADRLLQAAVNAHIFVLLTTCGLAALLLLPLLVSTDKVRDNSGHSND